MIGNPEPTDAKKLSETQRNKVGVYDDTKALLEELKGRTGVPHAMIVRKAVASYATRLRPARTRRRTTTAA